MGRRIRRALVLALVALLAAAGRALVVWGSNQQQRHAAVLRDGVRTEGTVTGFDDVAEASERSVTVTFADVDGRVWTARGLAEHDQHPKVGDPATVAYRTGDPGDNALPSYDTAATPLVVVGVALTGFFVVLPLLGLLAGLRGRRRRRRRHERRHDAARTG